MKPQLTIPYPTYHPDSYRVHIVAILLIFVTACSVFKEKSFFETDSLLRRNSRARIKEQSVSRANAIRVYSNTDSSEQQTFAEIFPSGIFQYSPNEGYKGQAEKVLIHERIKKEGHEKVSERISQNRYQQLEVEISEKSKRLSRLKDKEVKTRGVSWISIAGCLFFFLGIYIFRKKW